MAFRLRKHNSTRRPGGEPGLPGVVLSPSLTLRHLTSIILGMVFTASLIILLAWGTPPLPYRRGQVAKSDLRARVSFWVVDEEKTKAKRDAAAANAPSVYRIDRSAFARTIDNLKGALPLIRGAARYEELDPVKATALGITAEFYGGVKAAMATASDEKISQVVSGSLGGIIKQGCLSASDVKSEQDRSKAAGITIVDGEARYEQPFSSLIKPEELPTALSTGIKRGIEDPALAAALTAYFQPSLKPFLLYDKAETDAAKKAAADATPQEKRFYEKDDVLVRRDTLLDKPQIDLLEKEREAYASTIPPRDKVNRVLGMAITVSFLVWLFGSYVSRYEPRVLTRRSRILILMALAVVLVAVTRFFVTAPLPLHLVPVALFGMAVAVAYSALFSVGYTLFLSILVGVTTGGDFALAVSLFLGAAMGVLVVGRVSNRSAPFGAGLAAGAGTFLATWGTGLLFHSDYVYRATLTDSFYGLLNGVVCGILVSVLLPFVERAFNVVTELSLLELVDLNKPILRRLALEAPGSYNHSMVVGNMSDAAAEVIGASRLLARAGGYYHDIGKLSKPDYFVENRGTAVSRHYNLSPTMSALIIISHVKDAVEIAREYRLPPPVIDIIKEHHGTTLVEYFYREAIEQVGDESRVSDQTFRYPGPKPHSKEAAIVMLADSVESASRTVNDPTPHKLESLVVDISRRKLADAQFDECNLTLYELRQIELSLIKSLAGIFHSRIKYPGREL